MEHKGIVLTGEDSFRAGRRENSTIILSMNPFARAQRDFFVCRKGCGMKKWIDRLEQDGCLAREEWVRLLSGWTEKDRAYAAEKARAIYDRVYGKQVFVRGLIEFTNYCRNDCYYCGIRRGNEKAERYRLGREEILACCKMGYELGFRTFVLQGGEDPWYTQERMCDIIREIRAGYPDCAVTLSIGERTEEDYRAYREAGADRYLLRHETADPLHYRSLHPAGLSYERRMACLWQLKALGYQTGCGFMVGSPGQTAKMLAQDMELIHRLKPQMVGIGPFIPQKDTPFGKEAAGGLELTLFLLSLIRIMEKDVLLPATTALGTIHPQGRELGILAGANVVMPNLSPLDVRKKYLLYDNKISVGAEAAECRADLDERMRSIGYEVVTARGDWHGSRSE